MIKSIMDSMSATWRVCLWLSEYVYDYWPKRGMFITLFGINF